MWCDESVPSLSDHVVAMLHCDPHGCQWPDQTFIWCPFKISQFYFYRRGKIVFHRFKTTWSVIYLVFSLQKVFSEFPDQMRTNHHFDDSQFFPWKIHESPSYPHSGLEWICLCPVQITVMKICFLNNIDWINLYNGLIFLNKMSTALYSIIVSGYHFR